jgi:hypothetical protein
LELAALAVGAVLLAQGLMADEAGPAARAVRLSNVEGTVHVSQGGQVLAETAVANAPLFEGTQVVTGDDGRAEIQFEEGSVARISPNSSLTLKVLRGQGGTGEAVMVLDVGLGYFELEGNPESGTVRVQFGSSVVTSSGAAVIRVDLDSLPGQLAVFAGNAHLERGTAVTLDVHGGESLTLSGTDAGQYNLAESIEPDSWDTWNSDRDQAMEGAATARTATTNGFADNGNPAWNDLDANGSWYNVPGQGNVWSPYEASDAGWDPYGDGNWMYQPAYGYLWVSGNPWGYLPYHCGMWNWYDSFGWGWAPGFGGCRPWWGGGFYGGPFIGSRFGGYRPPMRPRRPIPTVIGRHSVYEMVAVSRRSPSGAVGLPSRDRTTVVEIAGHTVQPERPLSPRPQYTRAGAAAGGHGNYQGTYATHGAAPGYSGTRAVRIRHRRATLQALQPVTHRVAEAAEVAAIRQAAVAVAARTTNSVLWSQSKGCFAWRGSPF